jgi:hypothetical protein
MSQGTPRGQVQVPEGMGRLPESLPAQKATTGQGVTHTLAGLHLSIQAVLYHHQASILNARYTDNRPGFHETGTRHIEQITRALGSLRSSRARGRRLDQPTHALLYMPHQVLKPVRTIPTSVRREYKQAGPPVHSPPLLELGSLQLLAEVVLAHLRVPLDFLQT